MPKPSDPVPRVSVVVPVHNRRAELARLLHTLARQRLPLVQFEVLVCDDGSTQSLRDLIEKVKVETGLNVRYLRQNRSGAAAARNKGLLYAAGAITAFTDSDCEVVEGWLETLVGALESEDVAIVGGAIEPHPASPLTSQCCNFIMTSAWGGGARDPRSLVAMNYHPRTGNAAVRTDFARRCGGLIRARHGEDVDFASRVMASGQKAVFAPGAIVYHNEHRSLAQIATEAFWKGRARARLWQSRGAMELIHAAPAALVVYLVLWPLLAIVVPSMALAVSSPGIAYAVLCFLAGCHSGQRLKSGRAVALGSGCVVLMHTGYGIGLLSALAATPVMPSTTQEGDFPNTNNGSVTSVGEKAPVIHARK